MLHGATEKNKSGMFLVDHSVLLFLSYIDLWQRVCFVTVFVVIIVVAVVVVVVVPSNSSSIVAVGMGGWFVIESLSCNTHTCCCSCFCHSCSCCSFLLVIVVVTGWYTTESLHCLMVGGFCVMIAMTPSRCRIISQLMIWKTSMLFFVGFHAVATRSNFLIWGVVRASQMNKSDRMKSCKAVILCSWLCALIFNLRYCPMLLSLPRFNNLIRGNWTEYECSFFYSLGRGFLPVSQKMPVRTSGKEIGRIIRRVICVIRHIRFPHLRSLDNTSDEEIAACSCSLIYS